MLSMVKQIIIAYADFQEDPHVLEQPHLNIAEFFCDTIQGEGHNLGYPASFLRMRDCTLNCTWCDTREVWRTGHSYTFDQLFKLIDEAGLVHKWQHGQHLVLTGGSPLKQQENLLLFILALEERYGGVPYLEIENECTLLPIPKLVKYIQCWNNSPKLASSKNKFEYRYKSEVLQYLSKLPNSWFKFVVSKEEDWEEIDAGFLIPELIDRSQIILMPQGATRAELEFNRPFVIEMAIENGVRFSDRLHITIWDKKTGV